MVITETTASGRLVTIDDAGNVTVGAQYRRGCQEHQNVIRCAHFGERVLTLVERDDTYWLTQEWRRERRVAIDYNLSKIAPREDPLKIFLGAENALLAEEGGQ